MPRCRAAALRAGKHLAGALRAALGAHQGAAAELGAQAARLRALLEAVHARSEVLMG